MQRILYTKKRFLFAWLLHRLVRSGTPQFLLRSRERWYGMLFLLWYGYGTLVRYAFFVKVRVRYVGRLFELKILDFSHIALAFCV